MHLILANVLWSQLVWSTMEVLGELFQNERVGFYGILGVISPLEFIQHQFSQMGHKDLLSLVTQTIPA
jgi:hypothetical protein